MSLDDDTVSLRHAEVVRLSPGCLHVTDRLSTNGTFVLDAGVWRPVRQSIVEPGGRIRFGACELTVEQLDALCPREAAPAGAGTASPEPARAPDPGRRLVRDPETGRILEQ